MNIVDLDLQIGSKLLMSKLNLQLEAGQCWCVIGRNGAGKSTLLRTIAGLRAPEGGVVSIDGMPIQKWPLQKLARRRAYLPQGRSDVFSYSVIETVLTSRYPYHDSRYWESESDYSLAYQALQSMDVHHLAHRDLRTLSGGERQRVAIAATIAQDASILLLDEPTNALDLSHQVGVMDLLARLCCTSGKTVVLVSHDLNLAHAVASHALLLFDDGTWKAGPAAEVMQSSFLSDCLGHTIESMQHGARTIFLPMHGKIFS